MIPGLFIAAAFIYCLLAALPYTTLPFLYPKSYYALGAICSVLVGAAWLTVAKYTPVKEKIVLLGAFWDVMLTLIYIIIPVVFFSIKLTTNVYLGIGVIVFGMILTKI